MFKRLFSCFNEATQDQQVDLSRQTQNNQFKPQMHPESNIQGQVINFEFEDPKQSSLQLHFLQSQSSNPKFAQNYYYAEDGELEYKVTTAPQSKTKHYEQTTLNNEESDLVKQSQKQKRQSMNIKLEVDINSSKTEKKLNNYLQQAQYLSNNNVKEIPGHKQKSKIKLQSFSLDNNNDFQILGEQSNNSSRVMFNAFGVNATLSSNDKSIEIADSMIQQINDNSPTNNQKKKTEKKNKASNKQIKIAKRIQQNRNNQKQFDQFQKQRYSDPYKYNSTKLQSVKEIVTDIDKTNQKIKIIEQIEDNLEDEYQEFDDIEGLSDVIQQQEVLNVQDGQQIDLGTLKLINKRQSSKTEVNPPLGGTLNKNLKNKISLIAQTKTTVQTSNLHKKTQSTLINSTKKAVVFHQRNISTGASPMVQQKHTILTQKRQSLKNNNTKQLKVIKTIEIQEDQNEDDDERPKQIRPLSPSSQSSFSFQPRFYNPQQQSLFLGQHSASMNEQLTSSALHTQQILRKGHSKQL